ncbi:hypothetical protein [Kordiimonas aestuarii]|uniref:hypothetical protein n=1 Tax=Kordiimonas aestuarii TaxID=1005925 RepID=UPI0021D2080B|nr:hypothetical protein [Kordiimonas aestuarii]
MRTILSVITIIVLTSCTTHKAMGPWPDMALERKILERPSLEGRIIAIEQVPRFLVSRGTASALNHDPSFDHYLLWDWCRGNGFEWQMITLRPDGRASSGWSYTRTVMTAETADGRDIKVTEGFLKGTIVDYKALRAAGLAFFQPGVFTCDIRTADAVANAGA